jgi:hypothetical protein
MVVKSQLDAQCEEERLMSGESVRQRRKSAE